MNIHSTSFRAGLSRFLVFLLLFGGVGGNVCACESHAEASGPTELAQDHSSSQGEHAGERAGADAGCHDEHAPGIPCRCVGAASPAADLAKSESVESSFSVPVASVGSAWKAWLLSNGSYVSVRRDRGVPRSRDPLFLLNCNLRR